MIGILDLCRYSRHCGTNLNEIIILVLGFWGLWETIVSSFKHRISGFRVFRFRFQIGKMVFRSEQNVLKKYNCQSQQNHHAIHSQMIFSSVSKFQNFPHQHFAKLLFIYLLSGLLRRSCDQYQVTTSFPQFIRISGIVELFLSDKISNIY